MTQLICLIGLPATVLSVPINVNSTQSLSSNKSDNYIIGSGGTLNITNGGEVSTTDISSIQLNDSTAKLNIIGDASVKTTFNSGSGLNAIYSTAGEITIKQDTAPNKVLISATGQNAAAIRASNTTLDLNGVVLQNSGDYTGQRNTNSGVLLIDNGSNLTLANSEITSNIKAVNSSSGFDGLLVLGGSKATLLNSNIEINHTGAARGVYVAPGSELSMTGGKITMLQPGISMGNSQTAVDVLDASRVNLDSVSIQMNGQADVGLSNVGSVNVSKIIANNVTLNLNGDFAEALMVGNKASTEFNNGAINVMGNDSFGARLGGLDSSQLSLNNSTILAQGIGIQAGDMFAPPNGINFNTLINGSAVTSVDGAALFAELAKGNFDITGGSVITGGNGIALQVMNTFGDPGATNVNLNVFSSKIYGDIITDLGSNPTSNTVANINLNQGSMLQGRMVYANNVSIDASSQWQMTGSSDVMALNHQGTTVFSAPVAQTFKTLTVHNNYQGGGLIQINTQLGADASPTDKLIVQGDTSGSTQLKVLNAGGSGDFTVGDGIEVVAVNGLSNGTFSLAAPVTAGIYEYTLGRGTGINARNWYLQNKYGYISPNTGAYLGNQYAAVNMFTDSQSIVDRRDAVIAPHSNIWTRYKHSKLDTDMVMGSQKTTINTGVLQIGGDVYHHGDFLAGVYAGYGHS